MLRLLNLIVFKLLNKHQTRCL